MHANVLAAHFFGFPLSLLGLGLRSFDLHVVDGVLAVFFLCCLFAVCFSIFPSLAVRASGVCVCDLCDFGAREREGGGAWQWVILHVGLIVISVHSGARGERASSCFFFLFFLFFFLPL